VYPFDFSPSEIVDLPAPGIPVRHTISFFNALLLRILSMKVPEIIIKIVERNV
jgi:hypothetical protein